MLDGNEVAVVLIHGEEAGFTPEHCNVVPGRRELTEAECFFIANMMGVDYGESYAWGSTESGCMQWHDLQGPIEYMWNFEQHVCVASFCYCAYDVTPP